MAKKANDSLGGAAQSSWGWDESSRVYRMEMSFLEVGALCWHRVSTAQQSQFPSWGRGLSKEVLQLRPQIFVKNWVFLAAPLLPAEVQQI